MTPAALMRSYYQALDKPDLALLDSLFTDDVDWRFPGAALRGGAAVRRSMERSLATGLRMEHRIGHMLEQGDTAICELEATNTIGGRSFIVTGAVVCEARDGRISRMAAYPDATAMTTFVAALQEQARRR